MNAILLHPADNILVAIAPIGPGEPILLDGEAVPAAEAIDVGHKLARRPLSAGEKVVKYGVSIGSMTVAAERGAHVHLHNMKSDYIASHARDTLERSTHP
ncbi:altronate hydrolase [Sphingomonas ginkgonis]|uniref:Altronate hydrolase n=1 Tax=Sphingomonas ginkgonis TaxID=2315330 RepID=A0A3R9WRB5_9SPHN|nr:UxaA family hydrolase [Sphingomonas ginkgonis]RST31529.1 altronate hydrolase [Sphingomonas ginkgonis]